ncbi:DUF4255 domain-containing protein [Streptomyces sp. NPDC092307]|uniref:DUF4255 domain-containing protein n=1 Tax=Streptomyces sp. NPDC092307 TaxID=3366013 RepID=UPI0038260987
MTIVRCVDEILESQLRLGPLNGLGARIDFDTPNRDWAGRRSGLCVNLFLHSVEEDLARRRAGESGVLDDRGVVVGYHDPVRYFRLGYALTAWGQSSRDEHSMLGVLLEWCVSTEQLPPGPGSCLTEPAVVKLREVPQGSDGSASGLWSSLGTEARPVLDLIITVPVTRPARAVDTEAVQGLTLRAGRLAAQAALADTEAHRRPGTDRRYRKVEEIF